MIISQLTKHWQLRRLTEYDAMHLSNDLHSATSADIKYFCGLWLTLRVKSNQNIILKILAILFSPQLLILQIHWKLSVTTTYMIKFIICDLLSNVF